MISMRNVLRYLEQHDDIPELQRNAILEAAMQHATISSSAVKVILDDRSRDFFHEVVNHPDHIQIGFSHIVSDSIWQELVYTKSHPTDPEECEVKIGHVTKYIRKRVPSPFQLTLLEEIRQIFSQQGRITVRQVAQALGALASGFFTMYPDYNFMPAAWT